MYSMCDYSFDLHFKLESHTPEPIRISKWAIQKHVHPDIAAAVVVVDVVINFMANDIYAGYTKTVCIIIFPNIWWVFAFALKFPAV